MKKIILFELNEVPLEIINYFRKLRPDSWIAINYNKFNKYETFSENTGHLSPWNTWPTLHRGVSDEIHCISELNQDLTEIDRVHPAIWDILTKNGISVGVFGSLHSYPIPADSKNYKYYVPDVFSPQPETIPEKVSVFQEINLNLARKSAKNIDTGIPYNKVFSNMKDIYSLGFRFGTIASIGMQLVEEKIAKWKVTRRRTTQAVLSFDVFFKLLKNERPDFTTFFTNHVASSLHRYWAATFPEDYEEMKFDEEWRNTYNNEIIFTMTEADKMLERLGTFVDRNPEYKLIVTSSMGQEAIESEPLETQLLLHSDKIFMQTMGYSDSDYRRLPAMVPQYNFKVLKNHHAFDKQLSGLKINGESIKYNYLGNGIYSINLGHNNLKEIDVSLNGEPLNYTDLGLNNVEIDDKSGASAYHVPTGHLFSYHPSNIKSEISNQQLITTDILPILCNNFGVKAPNNKNKIVFTDI